MNDISLSLAGGGLLVLLTPILTAGIVFLVGSFAIRMALGALGGILHRSPLDAGLHPFILSVAKIAMWVFLGITILGYLGIDTTSIVTTVGAVGLALSLAVKDSLTNVAGGVSLLVLKPFVQGDHIAFGGSEGTVAEIGIVHTILQTEDHKSIYIPNGDIVKGTVTNFKDYQKH